MKLIKRGKDNTSTEYKFIHNGYEDKRSYMNIRLRNRAEEFLFTLYMVEDHGTKGGYNVIDESDEELAILLMFREHLAEIKDWNRKDDEKDSNSKTIEIKGFSWRSETNENRLTENKRENRRINTSWKKL